MVFSVSKNNLFFHNVMYKNVIHSGKSLSFVLKDIDISGQNQYAMCTGPFQPECKSDRGEQIVKFSARVYE